ncbi:hypothetical protein DSM104443_00914 [Usitatibacter rugosus]|uniref:Polyketide cyclase/dehydrase/lipid transport protein n=1 Tax=Usitatibacter rugosus TaxID=2732067 RepID=A0A6M4GTM1_9PROT|nr:SRPBCC domain-containing protein [Usitatibacter rugosus]QJR09864.1 hypothetical protein DSM104443_00914 [Usitatibacter rugosus]
MDDKPAKRRWLRWGAPLLAGAVVGIAMRFVFSGYPDSMTHAMTAGFIYFVPVVVGAVAVYVSERLSPTASGWHFNIGALANVFFVIGTLLILIEGFVCAIIIVPLFAVIGGLSGLAMGAICRRVTKSKETLYAIAMLPFLATPMESQVPLPVELANVERTIVIHASPERVWNELLNARDIRPEEVERAWIYRIGVPVPQSGATSETPEGRVRHVTMGKDISFDEVITHSVENRYLRWTYRFTPESFPPYALDEHVVIGGHYFDVRDTSYVLRPVAGGTELTVRIGYRVSTRFNWYAAPVARFLMEDLGDSNLGYYRGRAERAT